MLESHVAYRIYTPDTANYGWIGSKQYNSHYEADLSLQGTAARTSNVVAVPMVANPKRERVRIAALIVSVEPEEVTTPDIESLLAAAIDAAQMHSDSSMVTLCMDALRPAQAGCHWHGTHYQGYHPGADKARHTVAHIIKTARREKHYAALVHGVGSVAP